MLALQTVATDESTSIPTPMANSKLGALVPPKFPPEKDAEDDDCIEPGSFSMAQCTTANLSLFHSQLQAVAVHAALLAYPQAQPAERITGKTVINATQDASMGPERKQGAAAAVPRDNGELIAWYESQLSALSMKASQPKHSHGTSLGEEHGTDQGDAVQKGILQHGADQELIETAEVPTVSSNEGQVVGATGDLPLPRWTGDSASDDLSYLSIICSAFFANRSKAHVSDNLGDTKRSATDALHTSKNKQPRRAATDEFPFPQVLYQLLVDHLESGTPHCISFTASGLAVQVHNAEAFSYGLAPVYFGHHGYQTFVNELLLHGFEQVKEGPDAGAFKHPLFQRGHPELCAQISRVQKQAKADFKHAQQDMKPTG